MDKATEEMLFKAYLKESNISLVALNKALKANLVPSSAEDEEVFKQLAYIRDNISKFVRGGNNLLLCSNYTGNGKTTWALRLAGAYLDYAKNRSYQANKAVIFINVPDYLQLKRQSISNPSLIPTVNSIEKSIRIAPLAIFDDIPNKGIVDFEENELYTWINSRQNNGLSSIFTTNSKPEDFIKTILPKLYDRLVNNSYVKILNGGSHRHADNNF